MGTKALSLLLLLLLLSTCALLLACASERAFAAPAPVYGYGVVHTYPHDATAYTEGLIATGDWLYESTGLYGPSDIRKVRLSTGAIVKRHHLASQYFGEGLTVIADTLYQLTYQEHRIFTYVERDSFELVANSPYSWEGWGLTTDGSQLIASDGSSVIRFLDRHSRAEIRRIQVGDDGTPITRLNELEYIGGRIFANVWFSDRIAVIDPANGRVQSWVDLSGLRDSLDDPRAEVLNGIAFEAATGRLYVTGKRWASLFEIDTFPLHSSGSGEFGSVEPLTLRSFPQPCRDQAMLSFTLPGEAPVSLRLFDIQGRLVRTLVQDPYVAGKHEVQLDASGLAPGVYIASLRSEGLLETKKLVVVR